MRVEKDQIDLIVETLKSSVYDASVYLFGSRTDDSKRGGDIDIFLTTEINVKLKDKLAILATLEKKGIQRKVDLVIRTPDSPHDKIYNEVLQKGIRLC